ncbi:hypothetical protein PIIN_10668 [Serendipita indica DSM 11827]|uniref:Uncharacterized protein n=1 Tax=Serendipita indica (strain DSM 11827) TaxID=1109443 RepID=G4TZD6_SERID|nr:hypothetical protein PIIN_10668 [Serendipita indica DSM 11827]
MSMSELTHSIDDKSCAVRSRTNDACYRAEPELQRQLRRWISPGDKSHWKQTRVRGPKSWEKSVLAPTRGCRIYQVRPLLRSRGADDDKSNFTVKQRRAQEESQGAGGFDTFT